MGRLKRDKCAVGRLLTIFVCVNVVTNRRNAKVLIELKDMELMDDFAERVAKAIREWREIP